MSGFLPLLRFVSLRHAVSSPIRSLLTLLGVALGVAMLVGMGASNDAIVDAFSDMAGRASGNVDLEVTGDEAGVDQELVDALTAKKDLVAHVAARIEQTSFLEGEGGQPGERVLVVGIDFLGDRAFLPFETAKGADVLADPLAFLNDPEAILVSETLAEKHGLTPGTKLHLRTTERMAEFHVESVLRETGKTRAFGGQMVVLFLDAAQLAFGRPGRVDKIDIGLAPGVDPDRARAEIASIVGKRGTVERPQNRASQLAGMTRSFRIGLRAQAMIAMLVGMFLIYNAVSVSVAQRKREIGILRSIGVSRRRISAVFLTEAAIFGAIGGAGGLAIGGTLARVVVGQLAPTVSQLYENIATPVPHVGWPLGLAGVLTGMLATLLAAWVPARRAAHTSPVETMRRDLHATRAARLPLRGLAVTAVVLVVISLGVARTSHPFASGFGSLLLFYTAAVCITPLFVAKTAPPFGLFVQRVFGLAARLGVDNVARELGRSALTACALVLATAMSVTVAAYSISYEAACMDWIESAIHADVVFTAGSPIGDRNSVPFSPALRKEVVDLPGVVGVDLLRAVRVPIRGLRVDMLSLDTPVYFTRPPPRVIAGPPITRESLTRAPSVFVSENFARRTGLGVGDKVELPTPTGPHEVTIVDVTVDYSSDQGWMLLDRKYMLEFWKDERIDALELYLAPGTDADAVAGEARARVARNGSGGGMFVTTNRTVKEEIRRVIQQTFAISRASEIVALAIAILGVVGTMLAAVIDRIREIGVLRAIGATRRQIVLSVMAEAGFLGLSAAIIGVVASIPSALIFVQTIGMDATGWSVPFRFPAFAATRAILSVVVFSVASGVVPGVKASRLAVTRALAYE
jgi:putative ABC transport system permease protein